MTGDFMSLSNQVIDFSDDVGHLILKQIATSAPDFVKTAQALTAEAKEKMPAAAFALVMTTKEASVLKKFPVSDSAQTWLSCEYFAKTAEQLPYVARVIAASNLSRACDVYNLNAPEAVTKLASQKIDTNKYDEISSRKEDTAHMKGAVLDKIASDGSKHFYALGERYPMMNVEFVKKAASYFKEYHNQFDNAGDRHEFAYNVIGRAKELGVDLNEPTLKKFANDVYGDAVKVHLKNRAELAAVKNPGMEDAYTKLASKIDDVDALTFARTLYLLDKKAGLDKNYGNQVVDAFQASFGNVMKKEASAYQWEKGDLSITGDKLQKAANDKHSKIKGYFGDSIADQLQKHPVEIFDSLPDDAKEAIVRISKGEI